MYYFLRDVSNVTDEYIAVMMNERKYYDLVATAITSRKDYVAVMALMQNMASDCRRRHLVGGIHHAPNRIQIYLHMAANMDRLLEVDEAILKYAQRNGYLGLSEDVTNQQPKEEVTTVEFSTVHYINDEDITKLSDDRIIDYIKHEKERISTLIALEVKSSNIDAKIKTHNENVSRLVNILDSRTK